MASIRALSLGWLLRSLNLAVFGGGGIDAAGYLIIGSAAARGLVAAIRGKHTRVHPAAIALAFWSHWLSQALYVFAALIWLIPDRRIEKALSDTNTED